MTKKNKNIDQPDAFSELFRQKLENHQMPVDPNSWSNLEQQLQPKQRQRKMLLWWLTIGSAALLALLFSVLPYENTNNGIEFVQNSSIPHSENNHSINTKNNNTADNQLIKVPGQNSLDATKNVTNSEQLTPHSKAKVLIEKNIRTKSTGRITNIDKFNSNETNTVAINSTNIREAAPQAGDSSTNEETKKVYPKIDKLPTNDIIESPTNKRKKKSKDWLIAAAFGSGGSASAANNYTPLMSEVGTKMFAAAQPQQTNILSPNDYSQKTYNTPLSVGLIVRRNLSEKIGIETGLVYSYLNSTFENGSNIQSDAQLKLHYLGIPVNLIIPIWKNQKLETYLSGGGTVEKGLQSVFVQNEHFGNLIITTTDRTKIDGLQWSINTSIGINYKLQQKISLYFEPKASYFFDNNQPISARTDQPVVIGLTAGLRFKF